MGSYFPDEFGSYLDDALRDHPSFRASYEAAKAGEWGPDVTAEERKAMQELNFAPNFHDFGSQDVLNAYRAGVEAGREAGFTAGQDSVYLSQAYQEGP